MCTTFLLVCFAFASLAVLPAHLQQILESGTGILIVGGEIANKSEIPYQIQLLKFGSHTCGGSILDETHVITAAHCVLDSGAADFTVRAGKHNIKIQEDTEQTSAVTHIFVHQEYLQGVAKFENDIAILRLKRQLIFTESVQPIALPKPGHISKGMTQTSGWGKLWEDGISPIVLYKVMLPIVDDASCEKAYNTKSHEVTGKLMICAGYAEGGKDSCQGDSGGPLVASDDGTYLAGIVSFGKGCGAPKYPGVYTEVVQYLDWIETTVSAKVGGNGSGQKTQQAYSALFASILLLVLSYL